MSQFDCQYHDEYHIRMTIVLKLLELYYPVTSVVNGETCQLWELVKHFYWWDFCLVLNTLGGEHKRNNTIYIVTPFLDCNLKYDSTNKMYTWPKDIYPKSLFYMIPWPYLAKHSIVVSCADYKIRIPFTLMNITLPRFIKLLLCVKHTQVGCIPEVLQRGMVFDMFMLYWATVIWKCTKMVITKVPRDPRY